MPCPYSEVFSDFPEVAVTWTHNTFRSYCALLRFFPTTFIETAEDKCQYRTLISALVLYKRPIHDITSKIRRQYSPHDYWLKIDWSIDRSLTNHTFKQERIMFRSTEREFQLTNKFNEFPQVFETWMKSNKQYSFSIKVLLSVIVNYKPQCLVWKKNWNVTVLMNCRSLCM